VRRSRAAEIFSFGYLVAISFPNRIDVWDRLCKYFDPFELMTLDSVTEHFGKSEVINPVLCLAMPGLIYIPPSDMVMFVTS
jgi:hypothetical protein